MGLAIRGVNDEDLLKKALEILREGKKVALAVIVGKEGSGPRDVGSKMIVDEEGNTYGTLGGGTFERNVISESLKALKEGRPKLLRYSFTGYEVKGAIDTGLICGGILTVYIDVLKPTKRVIIFGLGRVGKPVADVFKFLGFDVIVADPNPELIKEEYVPYASMRITGDVSEIANKIKEIVREDDITLVLHGEVEPDYIMVKTLLNSKARYVGLLGSRRKVIEFIKRLIKEGISKEVIESKLHAPIGIDIGADKPEEIAISIASQILSYIRGVKPQDLSIVKDVLRKL